MTMMTRRRRAPRAPRRPPRSLRIEIVVDGGCWTARRRAEAVLRRAVTAAASAIAAGAGELAIVLTDDMRMRALNRQWRRKDAATNVLSFPAASITEGRRRAGKRDPRRARTTAGVSVTTIGAMPVLGDIVIAYETTEREARAERKPFAHHLAHLAVHGFLHLAGYDHTTEQEAQAMEKLEAAILSRLGVPDPNTGAVP